MISDEFVYMHHWQPGDVLMSDTRCGLHRATEWDEIAYRRRLHRIVLIGTAHRLKRQILSYNG
jgi:taurine dioxygenase